MPSVEYKCFSGQPSKEVLAWVTHINQEIFQFHETAERLSELFSSKQKVVILLAFEQGEPVGFKIGFEAEPWCLESWRGGVLPLSRRQGIATKLMEMQHQWCVENQMKTIKTVTNSDNTAMLILNLRHGFEIVGSYVNRRKRLKILQEKWLLG